MPSKPKKSVLFFSIATILTVSFLIRPQKIYAAISACSASVSPSSAQPNTSDVQLNFSITNNDPANSVIWFRITKPFSGLTYKSYALYGWGSKTVVGDSIVFSDGTITPGGSVGPSITVDIDDINTSGSWTVEVSDDAGGAGYTACSGSLSFSVSPEGTDSTAPVISNLAVSDIGATSVTISWTTNENADSLVDYGLEYAGPLSASSATLETTHSLTLTQSVASATTYYYNVCSTDAAANQTCAGENTFTTASATSAGTATTTITVNTTTTVTQTVTKILVDLIAPAVSIATDLKDPFSEVPEIAGSASDASKIVKVEYSIDGGINWLPVDEAISLGQTSTTYRFTPGIFDDGDYQIKVRALDGAGNWGMSALKTLIYDRLPPLVGGNMWTIGPIFLKPDSDGIIRTLVGVENKIIMSAVGGPNTIDLLVGDEIYAMIRSLDSGLWSGLVNFESPGRYAVKVRALDGAGNETVRDLNTILVLEGGRVLDEGSDQKIDDVLIKVFKQDEISKLWELWDGKAFGQSKFAFFLPAGTYYLRITAPGYRSTITQIFKLDSSTSLNTVFKMQKLPVIDLGIFKLTLPFPFPLHERVVVSGSQNLSQGGVENGLSGKQLPSFILIKAKGGSVDLASLRGKSHAVFFISTWMPDTYSQISEIMSLDETLKKGIVIVSLQESLTKTEIFVKRGRYDGLNIVSDPDGTLVEPYGINSLPVVFFADRRGVVTQVKTGVVTKDEINSIMN